MSNSYIKTKIAQTSALELYYAYMTRGTLKRMKNFIFNTIDSNKINKQTLMETSKLMGEDLRGKNRSRI